jgi:gluconolactonase
LLIHKPFIMGKNTIVVLTLVMLPGMMATAQVPEENAVTADARVEKVAGGFTFTEGVASDAGGNVYFSDIPASRIHFHGVDGSEKVFLENSNRANGLLLDKAGRVIACEGVAGGRLVRISPNGKVTVLAEGYDGKTFNSPNDLWMSPGGGIYMTDPRYGSARDHLPQGGEHVYFIGGNGKTVIRVTDDLVRPNGVTGTADGRTLYIADQGDGKTFRYTILEDGTLTDKQLFASEGSDGMTLDSQGNVYLTNRAVKVYNPAGRLIDTIEVPENPTNVCFGGTDGKTLYITAQTSVYSVKMKVGKVFSN